MALRFLIQARAMTLIKMPPKQKGGMVLKTKWILVKWLRIFLEYSTFQVSKPIGSGFLHIHMEFFENLIFELR